MNLRLALLVVFGVVLAAGTFFMAKTWIDSQRDSLRRQQEALKPKTTESVNILVAKANLPSGLILQREHVEWMPWPEKGASKAFLMEGRDKVDEIVGAVVRGGILLGEPVAKGRVIQPGDRGFMAAVIGPDMRAISVKMKPDISVSGFIKPGDHVDMLLSHRVIPENSDEPQSHSIAETILADLRVIAIDQAPEDQSGKASLSKTMTFEVTKKQAEIITVAKGIGSLSVVLRSLARPDAKPNQIAKKKERRTRTWDSEASRVLPGVGGQQNQLQVIRGVREQKVGIPIFNGQSGGIAVIRQGATAPASASTKAGGAAARTISP